MFNILLELYHWSTPYQCSTSSTNLSSPSSKPLLICKNECFWLICHAEPINPSDLMLILKYAIKWDCKQKCILLFIILTATPGLPQAVTGTVKPSARKEMLEHISSLRKKIFQALNTAQDLGARCVPKCLLSSPPHERDIKLWFSSPTGFPLTLIHF